MYCTQELIISFQVTCRVNIPYYLASSMSHQLIQLYLLNKGIVSREENKTKQYLLMSSVILQFLVVFL
jgi:hypothetical protein